MNPPTEPNKELFTPDILARLDKHGITLRFLHYYQRCLIEIDWKVYDWHIATAEWFDVICKDKVEQVDTKVHLSFWLSEQVDLMVERMAKMWSDDYDKLLETHTRMVLSFERISGIRTSDLAMKELHMPEERDDYSILRKMCVYLETEYDL